MKHALPPCVCAAETLRSVDSFRADRPFPVVDDLHGAAVALIRLQDTYQLNMTQLPRGHITGFGPEPTGERREGKQPERGERSAHR